MSMETISTKRRRVYPRLFDHDEAQRRREAGEPVAALAAEYGVSVDRIYQVTSDAARARVVENMRLHHLALCDDCGGECTHNWSSKRSRHDRVVCRACSDERQREDALLERLDPDGLIHCSKCDQHLDIKAYRIRPNGYPAIRCRSCETAARRAYRHAHLGEDRRYSREYKRRRNGHNPCVVVQDAALEAARSSSALTDHTDTAGEQATTQALPLCQHGYYASRCPTCQDRQTGARP
jgi:hypothetical protein